jgi:hypothetical protein
MNTDGEKAKYRELAGRLPPGTFVTRDCAPGSAILLLEDHALAWTFAGYEQLPKLVGSELVWVLTPKSIVEVILAGYVVPLPGLLRSD